MQPFRNAFFRYRRWDGTQEIDSLSPDEVLEHLTEEMLQDGDLGSALRRLLQRGAEFPSGRRITGLQELLERLRNRREQNLGQYNLGGVLDEIQERLDRIIETERDTLLRRLDQEDAGEASQTPGEGEEPSPENGEESSSQGGSTGQAGRSQSGSTSEAPDPALQEILERMASQRLGQLNELPPGVGGRIQGLREYEFMDLEARQQFEELLQILQQQIMQNYFQGMQQGLQAMTPEAVQQTQQMLQELNQLLQQRLQGEPTDFDGFMQRWGHFFPEGIENVDQLAEYIQQQMAQMESLLNSMTPEMRRQLEDMVDSIFQGTQVPWELAQLAANVEQLHPTGGMPSDFPFSGDEPLSLQEALRFMGDMNSLDSLERELRQAMRSNDASQIDSGEMERLLGDEARRMLEQMQRLTKMLEEAGFIKRNQDRWEMTPRAVRKLGERALQDIFGGLRMGPFGSHPLDHRGVGVEQMEETKPYEYGDPFHLDVRKTVTNAVLRQGPGVPVRIQPNDFEITESVALARSATVIMLDMSYSMMMGGRFQAGRKVAIALDNLIRTQFPKDNLYVVAFSYFVLTLKPEMLFDSYWVEYGGGTNFQEALVQARKILGQHRAETKQILMITDGELTTYNYWFRDDDLHEGRLSPMSGLESMMREVSRCTREGITINSFIMNRERGPIEFIRLMTRMNRGRAFFTSPDRLGEYILMDYVKNKQKVVR